MQVMVEKGFNSLEVVYKSNNTKMMTPLRVAFQFLRGSL